MFKYDFHWTNIDFLVNSLKLNLTSRCIVHKLLQINQKTTKCIDRPRKKKLAVIDSKVKAKHK